MNAKIHGIESDKGIWYLIKNLEISTQAICSILKFLVTDLESATS